MKTRNANGLLFIYCHNCNNYYYLYVLMLDGMMDFPLITLTVREKFTSTLQTR